jgi:hypothetical protein
MKKAILSTVAALALGAASTGAFADAECQAGSAWGGKPGCGNSVVVPQAQPQVYGGHDQGASGWSPDMAYGQQGYYYGLPGVLGQILADGRVVPQYQYQAPYARTDRDRDGDGIRNNRDRYPDDPRYR